MNCPFCGYEDVRVVDSRPHEDKIRRRRECARCNKRFTTYEIIETPILMVKKKDNSFETFSRDKLFRGILSAIKKRPVSIEQITRIVDKIETFCANEKKSEISTSEIGTMVLDELRKIYAILACFGILFFLPLIAAPKSKFARFYANQGFILFLFGIVAGVVIRLLSFIPLVGTIVSWVLGIIELFLFIFALVNACQGKAKELPVIGGLINVFNK